MLRVGLTGSIAVGKSFVAGVLEELGCHVLDADQAARAAVAPGSPGLDAVIAAFGEDVLNTDSTLDRKKLGGIVFQDEEKRLLLNSLLHPFIMAYQDEQMRLWEAEHPQGIAVVDAALMIESGGYRRFDKLIVVHCRPEIQLARLIARDSLSAAEAQQRIDSQMSQEEKIRFADYLIDTSEGFSETQKRTEEVYRELQLEASAAADKSD